MKHAARRAFSNVICILLTITTTASWADTPISPIHTIKTCSTNGKYCFYSTESPAKTTVFSVDSPGNILWSTNEFVPNGYLSDNGMAIASCYPGINLAPPDATLDFVIVRILKKAKLVEKVSLKELYSSMSQLPNTISHREWGRCIGIVKNHIKLERADGTLWETPLF